MAHPAMLVELSLTMSLIVVPIMAPCAMMLALRDPSVCDKAVVETLQYTHSMTSFR